MTAQLTGKVVRKGAEIIIIFKANGKYYPATGHNGEVMDTYLHTGDAGYLNQLENEMEVTMPEWPQYKIETEMSDSLSAAILNGEMTE